MKTSFYCALFITFSAIVCSAQNMQKGFTYLETGKYPSAVSFFETILKTYPDLPFILIGDAGEHDADIYMEIVKNHPKRIKAIFLRSVKSKRRILRIKNLIENYTEVPFFIVDSSEEAIKIAKEHNFIA